MTDERLQEATPVAGATYVRERSSSLERATADLKSEDPEDGEAVLEENEIEQGGAGV